MAVKKRKRTKR